MQSYKNRKPSSETYDAIDDVDSDHGEDFSDDELEVMNLALHEYKRGNAKPIMDVEEAKTPEASGLLAQRINLESRPEPFFRPYRDLNQAQYGSVFEDPNQKRDLHGQPAVKLPGMDWRLQEDLSKSVKKKGLLNGI